MRPVLARLRNSQRTGRLTPLLCSSSALLAERPHMVQSVARFRRHVADPTQRPATEHTHERVWLRQKAVLSAAKRKRASSGGRVDRAGEAAIIELNTAGSVARPQAIGPLLPRSEALVSSRIEGCEFSQGNLARALIDPRAARGTSKTVPAKVVAIEEAIVIGERPELLTAEGQFLRFSS